MTYGQQLIMAENSDIFFAIYLVWKGHFFFLKGMYKPGLGFLFGLTKKLGRCKES